MQFFILLRLNPTFFQFISNILVTNFHLFFKILHIFDLSLFFSLYLNLRIKFYLFLGISCSTVHNLDYAALKSLY